MAEITARKIEEIFNQALVSERGVSRCENFKDGFSQERNMYIITIIQKKYLNYASSSLKVGISAT